MAGCHSACACVNVQRLQKLLEGRLAMHCNVASNGPVGCAFSFSKEDFVALLKSVSKARNYCHFFLF
jgi:hypothetical protein